MKRIVLISLFLFSSNLLAHGGGLNADGCHNETRTGGYHCHRGLTGYGISNEQGIISAWDDTEVKNIEGLVLKNIHCISIGLTADFVNRSNKYLKLEYLFRTQDSDKDPIEKYKGKINIEPESRESNHFYTPDNAIYSCSNVKYIWYQIWEID